VSSQLSDTLSSKKLNLIFLGEQKNKRTDSFWWKLLLSQPMSLSPPGIYFLIKYMETEAHFFKWDSVSCLNILFLSPPPHFPPSFLVFFLLLLFLHCIMFKSG
jgi:hypothetical protein